MLGSEPGFWIVSLSRNSQTLENDHLHIFSLWHQTSTNQPSGTFVSHVNNFWTNLFLYDHVSRSGAVVVFFRIVPSLSSYRLRKVKISRFLDGQKDETGREGAQVVDNVENALVSKTQDGEEGHDVAFPFGQYLLQHALLEKAPREGQLGPAGRPELSQQTSGRIEIRNRATFKIYFDEFELFIARWSIWGQIKKMKLTPSFRKNL